MTAALFAAGAFCTGATALFWRSAWVRAAAFCVLVVTLLGVWGASLGHPRPLMPIGASGFVLAYSLDEGTAIYVWLMPDHSREPLALTMRWGEKEAQKLRKAMQAASKQPGARVHMTAKGFGMRGAQGRRNGSGDVMANAPQGHGTGASATRGGSQRGTGGASFLRRPDDLQLDVIPRPVFPPKGAQ